MAELRTSRQREALFKELRSRCDHPSAEMLYDALKKEYPRLSLGTVYRNLALLCELGEIKKIPCAGGSDRYDGLVDPHDHFVCRVCGKVMDLCPQPKTSGSAADPRTADPCFRGYDSVPSEIGDVESHSLIFYGICRECRENGEK